MQTDVEDRREVISLPEENLIHPWDHQIEPDGGLTKALTEVMEHEVGVLLH